MRPADDRFPSLKRISLFSAVAHLCMFVYVWEGERVAAYGSTIVEKTYTENKCLSSLSADELYRINVQLKFRNGKKMKYERKWMRVKERGALLYREKSQNVQITRENHEKMSEKSQMWTIYSRHTDEAERLLRKVKLGFLPPSISLSRSHFIFGELSLH